MKVVGQTMIGFDSRNGRFMIDTNSHAGMMPPAAICMIAARPLMPFRGERLFVWSRTAASFLIHRILCASSDLLASVDPVPAEMFATRLDQLAELDAKALAGEPIQIQISRPGLECLGLPLTLPISFPGGEVILMIENIGDAPARFIAGISGSRADHDLSAR